MDHHNLVSLLGICLFLLLAWGLSWDRSRVNWRVLGWGVAFQLLFALFIFVFPTGANLFLYLNDLVAAVVAAADAGSRFMFGPLALAPGEQGSLGFIFSFQALPTIIFFSSLTALLYYIPLLPWLIRLFSRLFTRSMGISGAESLVAASNIFIGVESTLTIRPYLSRMTNSELGVVLTAGMATVASNVLALYVFTLGNELPTIAGHLVSASILSAPAAIVMAKLMMPELAVPETLGSHVEPHYERPSNAMEAIINGANAGVRLIVGIAALLIAVLGLVALLNSAIGWLGTTLGAGEWRLELLLGQLFYPLTVLMGVPLEDAAPVAAMVGERLVVTEVVSYQHLAEALKAGTLQGRSALITAYALCGFAHLASVAIFVGGAAALAPERTADLARIAPRALAAATLATLMTGAVAGAFYHSGLTSILH